MFCLCLFLQTPPDSGAQGRAEIARSSVVDLPLWLLVVVVVAVLVYACIRALSSCSAGTTAGAALCSSGERSSPANQGTVPARRHTGNSSSSSHSTAWRFALAHFLSMWDPYSTRNLRSHGSPLSAGRTAPPSTKYLDEQLQITSNSFQSWRSRKRGWVHSVPSVVYL
jgi:hypothetical protein